jgi:hypothetical protein
MSKTHDTSKLASRDLELRDDELDAVTGGFGNIKGESLEKDHKDWPSSIRSI